MYFLFMVNLLIIFIKTCFKAILIFLTYRKELNWNEKIRWHL